MAVFFIGLCAIQTERLEWQTEEIRRRAKEFGSWETACFVTLARTFGMGVNGDLMEQWKPMGKGCNRNPHPAFSFLANMVYQRKTSLQTMLACETAKEVTSLLRVSATPYWQMRSHFGAECKACAKHLSAERLNLIVINAVVPMLFAYGRYKGNEVYCDRAFDIIEQCRSEKKRGSSENKAELVRTLSSRDRGRPTVNAVTKHWEQFGIKAETAGYSQALIQLQREYCNKRQCLRCRFGYEFLRGKTKIEGYRNLAIEPDLFMELY